MDWKSLIFIAVLASSFFIIQEIFSPKIVENVVQVEEAPKPKPVTKKEETFYVLENEYIQLVFSARNGAIAEINLPFKSKQNKKSPINKIEADRILEKKYPESDLFPESNYFIASTKGMEKREGVVDNYYPLLRRSINPKYYAFGFEDEEVQCRVKNFEKNSISFEISSSGRRITKTFTLLDAPYCFEVNSEASESKNLWLTSGILDVELILDSPSPEIKYEFRKEAKDIIETVSLPKKTTESGDANFNWICLSNGFFGLILDHQNSINPGYKVANVEGALVPSRLSLIDANNKLYPADKFPGYELFLPLKSSSKIRVFAGPLDAKILKEVDTTFKTNYIEAKSAQGFLSYISNPFAKFLLFLMKCFYAICRSWGVSILLLTIALRLILYPLNSWSIKSQKRMQEVAPKIKAIQEKYKKEPKKAQMEIVKVYRESGGNPLVGGCLPVLIQIPILFGMFLMLKSSFELRGVVFIPGWIDNLTAPDVLFSWNYPIILIGNQLHFLPILLGVVTFLQQRFSIKPTNQKLSDQQRQQAVMGNIMSVVLIFIFYKLPSGLNIYYLFSTLLGILQQWFINKRQA